MKLTIWQWLGLALVGLLALQTGRIHFLKSDEAKWKAAAGSYADANKTNQTAIAELSAANKAWADGAKASQSKAPYLVQQNAEFSSLQTIQNTTTNQKLQVIYVHSASAKAWSAVVPDPAIAEQLRSNAGS